MDINNDPYLQGMLFNALVPHVGPQDEPTLQQYIFFAIKRKLPTTTIEVFDKLWFKAYNGVSDDAEMVNALYRRLLEHKENTRISSFELAIQIGITRHILTLSSYAQDIDHILLDPYTKSKLIEWVVSSNITASEMPMIERLGDIQFANREYEERKLFSSQISVQNVGKSETYFDGTESIISLLLNKLDSCRGNEDSNEKHSAIKWLVGVICEEINLLYPRRGFQAILAGN